MACRTAALVSLPAPASRSSHPHFCHLPCRSETSNSMYHLGEVRWRQGQRQAAVGLVRQSLDIMEGQVGGGAGGPWLGMAHGVLGWACSTL